LSISQVNSTGKHIIDLFSLLLLLLQLQLLLLLLLLQQQLAKAKY